MRSWSIVARSAYGVILTALVLIACRCAWAAEGSTGQYILGTLGPLAGVLPPPGSYLNTDFIFVPNVEQTVGESGGSPFINATGEAFAVLLRPLFVTPKRVFGANYGFSLNLPIAVANLQAWTATPQMRRIAYREERISGLGDLAITPLILGWHDGNLHYLTYLSFYVPIGQFCTGRLLNIGHNHYAIDPGIAVTWLDRKNGHELSAAMGMTFNTENPDTHYRSGNELHLDYVAAQHFPTGAEVGLTGFVYWQVTGDSGQGAVLGPFKGQAYALGPIIGYRTKSGTRFYLKHYFQFGVENRFDGGITWFSVKMPL